MELSIIIGTETDVVQLVGNTASLAAVKRVVMEAFSSLSREEDFDLLVVHGVGAGGILDNTADAEVEALCDGDTLEVIPSKRALAVATLSDESVTLDMCSLHTAASEGDVTRCELLIDAGVDVDVKNTLHQTPLMKACMQGHLEVCTLLVGRGADVNALDMVRRTCLMWASKRGHLHICELLLNSDADPTAVDSIRRVTSLVRASEQGNVDIVRLLLQRGAAKSGPRLHTKPLSKEMKMKRVFQKMRVGGGADGGGGGGGGGGSPPPVQA